MPNPTPGREFAFAVEYPPGPIRATAPTPGAQRMTFTSGQVDQMVGAAIMTGRIVPGRAAHWRAQLIAGGQASGEALTALLDLPPRIAASAPGELSDEELLSLLWPTPEALAEAGERRVAQRAAELTNRFAGYHSGPPLRYPAASAPAESLTLDEVYSRLYGR